MARVVEETDTALAQTFSELGNTAAHTWLKVPIVDDMERVMACSTLPALILGGEVSADPDAAYNSWHKALQLPTVKGLVIGRSLLYPPDDDVAGAVASSAARLVFAGSFRTG